MDAVRRAPPAELAQLCEAAALRHLGALSAGGDGARDWLGARLPASLRQRLLDGALSDTGLTEAALTRLAGLLAAPGLQRFLLAEPLLTPCLRERCYSLLAPSADTLRQLRLPLGGAGAPVRGELEALAGLLRRMAALRSLELPGAATDALLEAVGAGCPLLRRLDVAGSAGVTSRGLLRLLVPEHHRHQLMRRCLSSEQLLPAELRRLPPAACAGSLRQVRLRGARVTGCGLAVLLVLCPALESADHELTPRTVCALRALEPGLRLALTELSCGAEDAAAAGRLPALLAACPRLEALSCGGLRSAAPLLGQAQAPLRRLVLWKASLSRRQLQQLLTELRQLTALTVSFCEPVPVSLTELLAGCPRLEQLELTECRLVGDSAAGEDGAGDGPAAPAAPALSLQSLRLQTAGWRAARSALTAAQLLPVLERSPHLSSLQLGVLEPLSEGELERLVPPGCQQLTLAGGAVTSDSLWTLIGGRPRLRELTIVTHDWTEYNEVDDVRERARAENLALKVRVLCRQGAARRSEEPQAAPLRN
ncbi:hypothetical protein FJT64_005460 [Amphibalanus amphitrite]|uniref:Uncharacterized protein n=1 Tax=Amphibalanus amphitrite TaxID=1232801 RepID=A0A6A4VVZ0_AMPAM|nr:hypothetical protein FJT64_005460 [Amphibalanus amphitrite]